MHTEAQRCQDQLQQINSRVADVVREFTAAAERKCEQAQRGQERAEEKLRTQVERAKAAEAAAAEVKRQAKEAQTRAAKAERRAEIAEARAAEAEGRAEEAEARAAEAKRRAEEAEARAAGANAILQQEDLEQESHELLCAKPSTAACLAADRRLPSHTNSRSRSRASHDDGPDAGFGGSKEQISSEHALAPCHGQTSSSPAAGAGQIVGAQAKVDRMRHGQPNHESGADGAFLRDHGSSKERRASLGERGSRSRLSLSKGHADNCTKVPSGNQGKFCDSSPVRSSTSSSTSSGKPLPEGDSASHSGAASSGGHSAKKARRANNERETLGERDGLGRHQTCSQAGHSVAPACGGGNGSISDPSPAIRLASADAMPSGANAWQMVVDDDGQSQDIIQETCLPGDEMEESLVLLPIPPTRSERQREHERGKVEEDEKLDLRSRVQAWDQSCAGNGVLGIENVRNQQTFEDDRECDLREVKSRSFRRDIASQERSSPKDARDSAAPHQNVGSRGKESVSKPEEFEKVESRQASEGTSSPHSQADDDVAATSLCLAQQDAQESEELDPCSSPLLLVTSKKRKLDRYKTTGAHSWQAGKQASSDSGVHAASDLAFGLRKGRDDTCRQVSFAMHDDKTMQGVDGEGVLSGPLAESHPLAACGFVRKSSTMLLEDASKVLTADGKPAIQDAQVRQADRVGNDHAIDSEMQFRRERKEEVTSRRVHGAGGHEGRQGEKEVGGQSTKGVVGLYDNLKKAIALPTPPTTKSSKTLDRTALGGSKICRASTVAAPRDGRLKAPDRVNGGGLSRSTSLAPDRVYGSATLTSMSAGKHGNDQQSLARQTHAGFKVHEDGHSNFHDDGVRAGNQLRALGKRPLRQVRVSQPQLYALKLYVDPNADGLLNRCRK